MKERGHGVQGKVIGGIMVAMVIGVDVCISWTSDQTCAAKED